MAILGHDDDDDGDAQTERSTLLLLEQKSPDEQNRREKKHKASKQANKQAYLSARLTSSRRSCLCAAAERFAHLECQLVRAWVLSDVLLVRLASRSKYRRPIKGGEYHSGRLAHDQERQRKGPEGARLCVALDSRIQLNRKDILGDL